jgi:hypothetical protein
MSRILDSISENPDRFMIRFVLQLWWITCTVYLTMNAFIDTNSPMTVFQGLTATWTMLLGTYLWASRRRSPKMQ